MIHRLARFRHDTRLETIWLTIYADLITNMMLVFLALYGLTVMGDDALTRAIQSMKLTEAYTLKDKELEFKDLAPALRTKFRDASNIKITEEIGAVRIEFGEKVLFESGRAVPQSTAVEAVAVVSELLQGMDHTIVVEGHTDAIPLRGGLFKDNSELSMARAMSIVQLMIKNGLPADQIAAAAYGSYRPRATNSTALGRSINRRVEIALFKDFPHVHK